MFGVFTLGIGLASVPIDGFTHQTGPFGGPVIDWLVTAVPMVSAAAVGTVVAARRPGNPIGWMLLAIFLPGQVGNDLIGPIGSAALPVCIGVAVLKYRLLEIDRIISRVISYAIYNADLTVAAFASRLKDAVDLNSVRGDLATVVQKTLEPAHISVWMNEHGETG